MNVHTSNQTNNPSGGSCLLCDMTQPENADLIVMDEQSTTHSCWCGRAVTITAPTICLAGILLGGLLCILSPIIGGAVAATFLTALMVGVTVKCIYNRQVRQSVSHAALLHTAQAQSTTPLLSFQKNNTHDDLSHSSFAPLNSDSKALSDSQLNKQAISKNHQLQSNSKSASAANISQQKFSTKAATIESQQELAQYNNGFSCHNHYLPEINTRPESAAHSSATAPTTSLVHNDHYDLEDGSTLSLTSINAHSQTGMNQNCDDKKTENQNTTQSQLSLSATDISDTFSIDLSGQSSTKKNNLTDSDNSLINSVNFVFDNLPKSARRSLNKRLCASTEALTFPIVSTTTKDKFFSIKQHDSKNYEVPPAFKSSTGSYQALNKLTRSNSVESSTSKTSSYLEPELSDAAMDSNNNSLYTQENLYASLNTKEIISPQIELKQNLQKVDTTLKNMIQDLQLDTLRFARYHEADQACIAFEDKILTPLTSKYDSVFDDNTSSNPELADAMQTIQTNFQELKNYLHCAQETDFRKVKCYNEQVNIFTQIKNHVTKCALTKTTNKYSSVVLDGIYCKSYQKIPFTMAMQKIITYYSNQGKNKPFVTNAVKLLTQCEKALRKVAKDAKIPRELFDDALRDTLSCGAKSYTNICKMFDGENWHTVEHKHTPAGAMRLPIPESRLADLGDGNCNPMPTTTNNAFYPSVWRNVPHAINLMSYEMWVDGKLTSKKIRVGTPWCCYGNQQQQQEVSKIRFREILIALIMQNQPDKLKAAIQDPENETISIDFCYINLMSPDQLRTLANYFPLSQGMRNKSDNERHWVHIIQNMMANFEDILENGRLAVKAPNGQIIHLKIKVPNALFFVAPCNQLAAGTAISKIAGTWDGVTKINRKALVKLVGLQNKYEGILGNRLNNLEDADQVKAKELADKLWAMINEGLKSVANRDLFAFSSTLKHLTGLLQLAEVTGCKSNKDRGSLDETHHQTSIVNGDEIVRQQMLMFSGHIQGQMLNTGIPGYKIGSEMQPKMKDVFSIIARKEFSSEEELARTSKTTLIPNVSQKSHLHKRPLPDIPTPEDVALPIQKNKKKKWHNKLF